MVWHTRMWERDGRYELKNILIEKNPNVIDNTKPNVIGSEPRTKEFSSGTLGFLFWTAFRGCGVNVSGIAYDCNKGKYIRVKRAFYSNVSIQYYIHIWYVYSFLRARTDGFRVHGHVKPKKPIICLFYKTDRNKQILFATWAQDATGSIGI